MKLSDGVNDHLATAGVTRSSLFTLRSYGTIGEMESSLKCLSIVNTSPNVQLPLKLQPYINSNGKFQEFSALLALLALIAL